jgi:hypothetical protein
MAIQIVQVFPVGLVPGLESLETERGLRGFRRIESKEKLRQLRNSKTGFGGTSEHRELYIRDRRRVASDQARGFGEARRMDATQMQGPGRGGWICGAVPVRG